MASRYIDSMGGTSAGGYTSYIRHGWLGPGVSSVVQDTDSNGNKYMLTTTGSEGGIYIPIPGTAPTEVFIGAVLWQTSSSEQNPMLGVTDGSGNMLGFLGYYNNNGYLYVVDSTGTAIANAVAPIAITTPAYYEIHCYDISGSTFKMDVRVNSSALFTAEVCTATLTAFHGINIQQTSSNGWASGDGAFIAAQWLYCNDATGSRNNTWRPSAWVVGCNHPSAAGQSTQWTPSTGTNWSAVNTVNPSGTPYVQSATINNEDVYEQSGLSAGLLEVDAYQLNVDSQYQNGTVGISPVLGNGSTVSVGAQFNPASTFGNTPTIYDENPLTSAAWALADFNTLQIGIKQTA